MVQASDAGADFLIRKSTFIVKNTRSIDEVYLREKKVSHAVVLWLFIIILCFQSTSVRLSNLIFLSFESSNSVRAPMEKLVRQSTEKMVKGEQSRLSLAQRLETGNVSRLK